MKIKVQNCVRCQNDHEVYFKLFHKAPEKYTHWAMCPNTCEPILMYIEEVGEEE